MYTLYGKKGSGSASVEAALAIIGASCRIVETASWEQNDAFAELLALNPLGQIPTLKLPDGSALPESAAILIHLGSVHPDSGLLPRVESARAQAIRGLVFIEMGGIAAASEAGPPGVLRNPVAHRSTAQGRARVRTALAGQLKPVVSLSGGNPWP